MYEGYMKLMFLQISSAVSCLVLDNIRIFERVICRRSCVTVYVTIFAACTSVCHDFIVGF